MLKGPISKGPEVIDAMTLTFQPFTELQSYGKEIGSQNVLQTEGTASCYGRASSGNLNVNFITLCCRWWIWSLVGGIPNWFGCAVAFAPALCPAGRKGIPHCPATPWVSERLLSTISCSIPPAQLSLPTSAVFLSIFLWGKYTQFFSLTHQVSFSSL